MVGDENAEMEAPPICCHLGLLAPVCLKVGILCKELVDIQHPGFVQPVGQVGELGMLHEMAVNIQCPGFVQLVGRVGESEMVHEVMVNIQCPGLMLSAEGGLCWQHPHRPTRSLLVEHVSAICAYEGPTLVLACRNKDKFVY